MSLMFAIPRKSIISFFFKQYKIHDSHSLDTKVQGNHKGNISRWSTIVLVNKLLNRTVVDSD